MGAGLTTALAVKGPFRIADHTPTGSNLYTTPSGRLNPAVTTSRGVSVNLTARQGQLAAGALAPPSRPVVEGKRAVLPFGSQSLGYSKPPALQ